MGSPQCSISGCPTNCPITPVLLVFLVPLRRNYCDQKCQVVLLLSGGLGTENRKDGGSTPPLATTSDQAKRPNLGNLRLLAVPRIVQFSSSDCTAWAQGLSHLPHLCCRIRLYGDFKCAPAAARTWVTWSSDSPVRRPIPLAARGPGGRARAGRPAGVVVDGYPRAARGMEPQVHP
jgi:hypothetical protein